MKSPSLTERSNRRRWMVLGLAAGVAAGAVALLIHRAQVARRVLADRVGRITERAVQDLGVGAESRFVIVNGLKLHTVVAGRKDGPLAVLLHGYPESWYSWRNQIPPLIRAGYRVVVPDQRGYNLSEKPTEIRSYQINRLTADVRELIRISGYDKAVVVAHDWGGVVAWRLAMDHPDLVDRLIVMNAPHPAAFARELRTSWSQRLKSWYTLFFQLPWLPEALLTLSPRSTAQLFFRRTAVRTGAFSDADLEIMITALAQPGAMRTMIHWYRAAYRYPASQRTKVIKTPTLLIWAEDDVALDKSLTYGLERWVPNLTVHYIPRCGHWVQNEAPDEVNARMMDFQRTTNNDRQLVTK